MGSRTYSIKELLQLRGSTLGIVPDTLQVNDEFVDLVKDQAPGTMPSTHDQRAKKANGRASSSTESDEILFRGKNQQRNQWKYRGRTESEVTSNEPVSAPTGLAAQQSEGFQKFFKAVVSPTHVRVTAGGRIVPNTRGSVSPTAKWDKEYSTVGTQNSAETFKEAKPSSGNGIGGQMAHPLISPQIPGHPGFFQHMGVPMPLYPFHQGIPIAYSMPAPQAASTKEQAAYRQVQQDAEETEKPRPAPIRIPTQSHHDGNRPFYHNGNVVYPQAYGPAQVPVPMVLASPYMPPGILGGPAFANAYAGSAGAPNQFAIAPAQFGGPSAASSSNQPLQAISALMQVTPHITSIRPSEFFRDQMQFNKHQIDEEENVQRFEAIYYPQLKPSPTPSRASSTTSRREATASQNSSVGANESGRGLLHYRSSEQISSRCTNPRSTVSDYDPRLETLIQSKRQRPGASEPSKTIGSRGNVSTTSASNLGIQPYHASQSEGQHPEAQSGPSSAYELGPWQVPSAMSSQQHGNAPGHVQPSVVSVSASNYNQPYLIGTLPRGMQPHNARAMDYKQARYNYWGQFDATRPTEPATNYKFLQSDPFHHNREVRGTRSQEAGHRVSKAIPIVAPDDAGQDNASGGMQSLAGSRVDRNTENLSKMTKSIKVPSPSKSSEVASAETKQSSSGRRALDRFTTKSGHELWQTMLKRGATSGAVLPSTVSSTTATGYLPQYHGYAAASLGPAISNTGNSSARVTPEARNKAAEYDAQAAEKTGENRPPNETRSEDYDPVKDVQERMLRDAERRGVIGSEW
ncbi:hypothetical protein F5Y13DRAFT_199177 [Hypoxylon sp. FL1857]|nr:hypothetical protein F5Y13DRAFT_199177 [Hypoxylon sp. FL1857]